MKQKMRIFQKWSLASILLTALFLLTTGTAQAGNNDFRLERLCNPETGCFGAEAIADFKSLSRAYGSLLAPMHFQPASTLGQAGFEIAAEAKMSFALGDDTFWRAINKNADATPDADGKYSSPDMFSTIQLHMRKGLPFSLEVEGVFNWLAQSEMFYVGAGLRWAITEGWWFLPDVSVRGHVGTIVGASQLSLVNVNVDFAISYTWGMGGIASITPYAGYSLLNIHTSSRPLVIQGGDEPFEAVFGGQWQHLSRAFLGVQLQGDFFVFAIEGEYGTNVASVGAKIGATF